MTSLSYADDLLSGIEHSSELGTDRKLRNIGLSENPESRDFSREDLEEALKDAR